MLKERVVEIATYGSYYHKQNKKLIRNIIQKQIQKDNAIIVVCSAGMKFCNRAKTFLSSFSLITLYCGGLDWPWVRNSLAREDRYIGVCSVLDYSCLGMRGRIPLYWEI